MAHRLWATGSAQPPSMTHRLWVTVAREISFLSRTFEAARYFNELAYKKMNEMMRHEENTPPDTQAVRRCLLNHRRALAEIQGIRQENLEESFRTPQEKETSFKIDENMQTSQSTWANISRDIILYKNPAATLTVLIAGSFLFSFARFLSSDSSRFSLVSIGSSVLLGRIAYHVASTIFIPGSTTKVGRSQLVHKVKRTLNHAVDYMADLHDTYITSENPYQSLLVSGCLWFLGIAGRYLSITSLCYVGFFSIFTIPVAVNSQRELLIPFMNHSIQLIYSKFQGCGFTKRQRTLLSIALASIVWLCSGWLNRLIGLFMVLLWVRCTLKPHEVQAIRDQAAPLTMSVKKSARRFSMLATKALRT